MQKTTEELRIAEAMGFIAQANVYQEPMNTSELIVGLEACKVVADMDAIVTRVLDRHQISECESLFAEGRA